MSFRAIAGIQKVFILQTNKRKKYWIPSQVGDDIGVVFGDDSGKDFGDDSGNTHRHHEKAYS